MYNGGIQFEESTVLVIFEVIFTSILLKWEPTLFPKETQ